MKININGVEIIADKVELMHKWSIYYNLYCSMEEFDDDVVLEVHLTGKEAKAIEEMGERITNAIDDNLPTPESNTDARVISFMFQLQGIQIGLMFALGYDVEPSIESAIKVIEGAK